MSTWFRTYGSAEVLDGLVVGAYPLDVPDVGELAAMRISRILNLVEDQEYRHGEREAVVAALAGVGIEEHRLELVDFGGLPAPALEAAVQEVNRWLDEGVRTYVHCRAGWQRSAAVATAVVAARLGIDVDRAFAHVQARKPSADPLPHQREDLRRWWAGREARIAPPTGAGPGTWPRRVVRSPPDPPG